MISSCAHFEVATAGRCTVKAVSGSVPRRFLGIIVGQAPSNSKSNQLHVDIFRIGFAFIHLRYIL